MPNIPKLIFAALMSIYFLWIAYDPMQGCFLDNVDPGNERFDERAVVHVK